MGDNRDQVEVIASYVHKSLLRVCGGGLVTRTPGVASNFCSYHTAVHSSSQVVYPRHEALQEKEWLQNLRKLAYESISFPNNGKPQRSLNATAINHDSAIVVGKPHDVEIRAALSFFHRYRHECLPVASTTTESPPEQPIEGRTNGKNDKHRRKTPKLQNIDATKNGNTSLFCNMDDRPSQGGRDLNVISEKLPPIQVISDLGLIRPIYTANELAELLMREIEDILWHERTETKEINNFKIYIIRAASSGLISMVTPNRVSFLRNAGRLPCRYTTCMKWCKGEKGLWWHEQREHGVEHSSATASAASCFGVNDLPIVVFENKTGGLLTGLKDIAKDKNINLTESLTSNQGISLISSQSALSDQTLKHTYFDLVKEGNLTKFKNFLLDRVNGNSRDSIIHPRSYLDKNGASAIHWAAGSGHLKMVEYLVKEYQCPSDQPQLGKRSFRGRTPLHWAARNGHLHVVTFLVENCIVNLDATTVDGTTAFCWSCWQGHLDIMCYLYSKGADVGVVNAFGCNAALWCSQSTGDVLEAIQWLESIGNDIKQINFNGHSVLHKAAQRGNNRFCEWIIGKFDYKEVTDLLALISPDDENCCPSDLAGMEGHGQLAKWLALREAEIAFYAIKINKECIPLWLTDGIEGAKHAVNRHNVKDFFERGAGIKRISANIVLSCDT